MFHAWQGKRNGDLIMRSKNPLVSVLMPVHNVKDAYLTLSIESILSQTYKDIEFIIVDDEIHR